MSILWNPSSDRVQSNRATRFIEAINKRYDCSIHKFDDLYEWTIQNPTEFWSACWDYFEIQGSKGSSVFQSGKTMHEAKFFPEARLNFAANLLRHAVLTPKKFALTCWQESKHHGYRTYRELFGSVKTIQTQLLAKGVTSGDVVAGIVPNTAFAVEAMLAATSIGAIWTSCSPDFGTAGIVDRFGQTQPKILFAPKRYTFKGEQISIETKVHEVKEAVPSIHTIFWEEEHMVDASPTEYPQRSMQAELESWQQFSFDHPLVILYSSGTTGKPKCIAHRAGGVLLEHVKELGLHLSLHPNDIFFYQTTCGWMMWNWLVSGLYFGATLVLYDGFPLEHRGNLLFEIAEKERISIFGTNAKWLSIIEKLGLHPQQHSDLKSIHTILSTGSPLSVEGFRYVYRKIKNDICLSSIAGGTDILGCFALGSATLPVHEGELQTRSLGLKVEVWNEKKISVVGQTGELVCTAPFPSQPLCFWNDEDDKKITAAYFEHDPNVWHHGDFVAVTDEGTMIFHGRSDAVLNPGGVRIGTAEIYQQVERISWIEESLVVGWQNAGDVEVILFITLLDKNRSLTESDKTEIKKHIRKHTTAFHTPKHIFQVRELPKTRNGKLLELAVSDVINGRAVRNIESMQNPESLNEYKQIADQLLTL